jgi:hypothetical protein
LDEDAKILQTTFFGRGDKAAESGNVDYKNHNIIRYYKPDYF